MSQPPYNPLQDQNPQQYPPQGQPFQQPPQPADMAYSQMPQQQSQQVGGYPPQQPPQADPYGTQSQPMGMGMGQPQGFGQPQPYGQDNMQVKSMGMPPQQQQPPSYGGGNVVQQPGMVPEQFNEADHVPSVPGHLQPPPDLNLNAHWWQSWENKQLKINENYRMYRVPKNEANISNASIIGVIDQSGSMGDCFHWLAKEWNEQIYKVFPKSKCCIFHNFSQEQDCLEEYPEMGTTEVEAGFKLLNEVLNRQDTLNTVTIIFVSDGADNHVETIYQRLDAICQQIPKYKKINFITIGVGEEFPTYLAMHLRQMYHNGENNIPPVFLVYNQHVQENWKVTFEIVTKYIPHNEAVSVQGAVVQNFPWNPPSLTAYENSWVFSTDMGKDTITFNGIPTKCVDKMTPKEVLDVGTILTSNAQLSNLKFSNTQATKAECVVSQKILDDLRRKFWGRGNKKKEEKEQLKAVQGEMKDLEKDPNLKKKRDDPKGDSSLALKLAVGAIGAGVGLYWLAGNYGDFANLMAGMNFEGIGDCGCCGDMCGPVCDTINGQCECCGDIADKITGVFDGGCGDCCEGVLKAGESCMGEACGAVCSVLEYVATFICGLLG